jgi:predicted transcriptional regulator
MSCCAPTEAKTLKPSAMDMEMAVLCKAMSHEVRVLIVNYLAEQEQCICNDFVKLLPLAQSTISQHLKILKDAGLINITKNGQKSCYCINAEKIKTFRTLTAAL